MTKRPSIVCIGAVHWDIIAQIAGTARKGDDVPGSISERPGGVAWNIARALAKGGLDCAVLGIIGKDAHGDHLLEQIATAGVDHRFLTRVDGPSDRYLAFETPTGEMLSAVADCSALMAVGAGIFAPLLDGRLGKAAEPFRGLAILDGNLPGEVYKTPLAKLGLQGAQIILVPASPAKAPLMRPALASFGATIYANLAEAEALCGRRFSNATDAAVTLVDRGARRAIVTNGKRKISDATGTYVVSAKPPKLAVRSTSGAGDTLLSAHIIAERKGDSRTDALSAGIVAASQHITKE